MLYDDERTVEGQFRMAKEPSTQIKEKLYSHMFEGSAREACGKYTPQLIKSDDSVDNFDCAEHPEMSAAVPGQDTEVGVDDMEYEAVDTSQHSLEQLSHTAYTDNALIGEQSVEIDAEGTNVMEYEADDFSHHSPDTLDCAEYTEIPSTQSEHYNEVDAEGINVVEYDADDFDQPSDMLQSTEEQEDSFDQQSHDYINNAESAAIFMKSRSSSAEEALEIVCTHCRLTTAY
jgi:hypothetical protein